MDRRFAIIGDIHANLDALNAVVDDARKEGVTDFVCVGDVVGYNAEPAECIRIVRDELACPVVCGNHDFYIANDISLADFNEQAAEVVLWTRDQLSQEDLDWLYNLPFSKRVCGFTIVHSTLDRPERWGYVFDNVSAEASFAYQGTPLCFYGHTHVPMIHSKTPAGINQLEVADFTPSISQKLFMNVGSVGQPRDGDPRASYVIFDPKTRLIKYRRLEYDVQAAMERVLRAGLPARLAHRLAVGR